MQIWAVVDLDGTALSTPPPFFALEPSPLGGALNFLRTYRSHHLRRCGHLPSKAGGRLTTAKARIAPCGPSLGSRPVIVVACSCQPASAETGWAASNKARLLTGR